MTPAPKRRWFHFSLRTLFVVVTVLACWLGWNLNIMRQRNQAMARIVSENGQVITYDEFEKMVPAVRGKISTRQLPIGLRLLGTNPVAFINVPGESFTEHEADRIDRLFPEARVMRVN